MNHPYSPHHTSSAPVDHNENFHNPKGAPNEVGWQAWRSSTPLKLDASSTQSTDSNEQSWSSTPRTWESSEPTADRPAILDCNPEYYGTGAQQMPVPSVADPHYLAGCTSTPHTPHAGYNWMEGGEQDLDRQPDRSSQYEWPNSGRGLVGPADFSGMGPPSPQFFNRPQFPVPNGVPQPFFSYPVPMQSPAMMHMPQAAPIHFANLMPGPSSGPALPLPNGFANSINPYTSSSFIQSRPFGFDNYPGTTQPNFMPIPMAGAFPRLHHPNDRHPQHPLHTHYPPSPVASGCTPMIFPSAHPHGLMFPGMPIPGLITPRGQNSKKRGLQQPGFGFNARQSPSRAKLGLKQAPSHVPSGNPSLQVASRSPLLEKFRNSRDKNWELRDLYDHILEFCLDQYGSRFVQQKIEGASEADKEVVFQELMAADILAISQDVFGNYVIQKLVEHGSDVQRTIILAQLVGHIRDLSIDVYGCRVVQKIVEVVPPSQQAQIVHEAEPWILACVKDAHGNHVVQKFLEVVPSQYLDFVASFQGEVLELARHPYGCRVLQRCLQHLPENMTAPLMNELLHHAIDMMTDQFGNYVVQYILEHGPRREQVYILTQLQGRFVEMSHHKYASNVCEKALMFSESSVRQSLLDEIMHLTDGFPKALWSMIHDQYANYVLQRGLTLAEGPQRSALFIAVKQQLANARRVANPASRNKHLASIERILSRQGT